MNSYTGSCGYEWACVFLALLLAGCAEIEPRPFEPSDSHLKAEDTDVPPADTIPDLVEQAPVLPEPSVPEPLEKYTVVVNEVPVRELLFALARDADLNVDIYPGIEGLVTLNAVDQTLPKILDRISRQVDIRYEFDDDTLLISPDKPFFRSYRVNYVNMTRDTTSTNRIETQISTTGDMTGAGGTGGTGGGGGGRGGGMNTASTDIESRSYHRFWQTLVSSISAIIGDEITATGGREGELPITPNVVTSPETGIVRVRATSKEHESIREYIDQVVESAQRQVLIQATIVEVELRDEYQAGIDWEALDIAGSGLSVVTDTLAPQPTSATRQLELIFSRGDVDGVIRLLEEFGAANVLSSPQLMVLNNQTAVLKVVENIVYFLIESEVTPGVLGGQPIQSVDTTPQTVPVGIVMAVTPQISETDTVTLNVRPTISQLSRVTPFVDDPNPNVAPGLTNRVPQIEVREMESMLRLNDGQTAILGGLMQDEAREVTDAIPGFSRIPLLGRAFRTDTREYRKSELVIFLRPMVIKTPSLSADLQDYRRLLERPEWVQPREPGGRTR